MTDLHSDQPSTLGGGVGGKLTRLVADATVYTRQKMGPHQNQVVQKMLADFTNHVSDEIRSVMGPLWGQLASDDETPSELRPLFKALATERGQAWAWIGGAATSSLMSGGLMDVLTNMLRPVTLPIIRQNPTAPLDAATAAAMVPRAVMSDADASQDAASTGVNRRRFNALIEMSRTYPTIDELRAMINRGEATLQQATDVLQRLGIPPQWSVRLLDLRRAHISPEDAAAMWNRDIVDSATGRAIAAKSGMSAQDFDRLTQLGGDPLSPQDLGTAYRRGIINRDRFERGIVQGPLRKEWFDVLEKLQISRMSTVDAADAVNQGYMPLGVAQRIARENGLDPEDFETLILMAGQPPGVEFAQDALNRGVISKAEFDVMFKESRIKNRYLDLLYAMRIRLIPQETARLLYRNGVYSRDEALSTLLKHGFSAKDAAALLELEETRGDDNTRELTRAQIIDLYESGLFTEVETVELLLGMGYTERDSQAMVYLADTRNFQKFLNSAITRVRSSYLSGKISDADASAQLDRLGVKTDQRDMLLSVWDTDRLTVTKTLTASQIRQALSKDLISHDDALKRLTDQGYAPDDAQLFLQLTA